MDSYAFSDKLMVVQGNSVLIGYAHVEKNEVQMDGKKYFTINISSFNSWLTVLQKVLKSDQQNPPDQNWIIFDTFNMKKEYNCKIDFAHQSISICKKFDANEVITLSKREIVETLFMLSFFLIQCLGLPSVMTLCFSQVINHFSDEPFALSCSETTRKISLSDIEKILQEFVILTKSDFIDLYSSIIASLNLDIDVYTCFNCLGKFQNFIMPLVELRLTQKMFLT